MGILLAACLLVAQEVSITHGPMTSAVDAHSANVWARASAAGSFMVRVSKPDGTRIAQSIAEALAESDWTLHWHLEGLEAGQAYELGISTHSDESPAATGTLRTPEADPSHASFAFGSCASDKAFAKQPGWDL